MFNPFEEHAKPIEETYMNWNTNYPKAYNKNEVDPYTRNRIILMNGIETEAVMFGHQFHRNCDDNELRRQIAMCRRGEQQQQKHVNWLSPGDETPLETTIGYEQVAVDLTAWLAQHEKDSYAKDCMDFALLEDFDHLYRYADLLNMDHNIPAHKLVQDYVEITPGRPTIAHHRHPKDTVRNHEDFKKSDLQSKLNALIITAAEQQTMNFYMNLGNTYPDDLGRQLFLEIGMVEEQHVTQYGSLLDPNASWLENLLLHEYVECYLYYSFYQDEKDKNIKPLWEMHLGQELAHLHAAKDLLQKYEKKEYQQVVGDGAFPELLRFEDSKDYVRDVLKKTVQRTADKENFVDISKLPDDHEYFRYQKEVNTDDVENVKSHVVIEKHIQKKGEDYRSELKGENPIEELQDRKKDNTDVGRKVLTHA